MTDEGITRGHPGYDQAERDRKVTETTNANILHREKREGITVDDAAAEVTEALGIPEEHLEKRNGGGEG